MIAAFDNALGMYPIIKAKVKETAGQDVVNGLYMADHAQMTAALNNIHGMAETAVIQDHKQGSGTAVSITGEFFGAVLAGLAGDVAPLSDFITQSMAKLQAQTRKSHVTKNFGTVIGLVSLMPELNVPVTTFRYVYSSSKTAQWMTSILCFSTENYSYDYNYEVVDYIYDPTRQTLRVA